MKSFILQWRNREKQERNILFPRTESITSKECGEEERGKRQLQGGMGRRIRRRWTDESGSHSKVSIYVFRGPTNAAFIKQHSLSLEYSLSLSLEYSLSLLSRAALFSKYIPLTKGKSVTDLIRLTFKCLVLEYFLNGMTIASVFSRKILITLFLERFSSHCFQKDSQN